MARKNLFELSPAIAEPSSSSDQQLFASSRPLAGFEKPVNRAGAVGAFSQSLGGINEKALRVDELEKTLASGYQVVELEPVLIDGSFVVDRLGVSEEDQNTLVEQIREHGQQVPILVRPNPAAPGRYQVAYGHRRLAAVKAIGISVRAVVRELSDEQLVVSQGQENNARTDLTFIERSFFASRLEERQFSRDVIMSALGVDKAALSRMISLVSRLPPKLIEAIGSAPGFGRARWADLADMIVDEDKRAIAVGLIDDPEFATLSSDQRFQTIFDGVSVARSKARTSIWRTQAGLKAVRISDGEDKFQLTFDKSIDADFGIFVEGKLDALYLDYQQSQRKTGD